MENQKYKFKFKVIGNQPSDLDKTIRQEGITAEITLRQILDDIERIKKVRTEIEAKRKLEEAKMKNIIINAHTKLSTNELEKMTEEDLQIIYIYSTSWVLMKTAEEKLEEIQKAIDEVSEDIQEILNQTGLKLEEPTKEEKVKNITNLPIAK